MKNVLVIGASGQIGSELTMTLRKLHPQGNIVAGYIAGAPLNDELLSDGPCEEADVTSAKQIYEIVDKYKIDTIYNLAALLSAVAESKPLLAWHIQIDGLLNILEIAREKGCSVFTPSSIGAFGPSTPKDHVPQETIQRPKTMYGVTKVSTELLSDYYFTRFGVDTRAVRFPGLISNVTLPGGGTTDYAVDIFYAAVKGEPFSCPIAAGTYMDMMYMPDALHAAISIMEADPKRLIHRNAFNVASMSLEPEMLRAAIQREIPGFKMSYQIDSVRQAIAESWPNSLDDSCARAEWDWAPQYNMETMTKDMLSKLKAKFQK